MLGLFRLILVSLDFLLDQSLWVLDDVKQLSVVAHGHPSLVRTFLTQLNVMRYVWDTELLESGFFFFFIRIFVQSALTYSSFSAELALVVALGNNVLDNVSHV